MTRRIPYQVIEGLPVHAQQQLRRDFQEIEKGLNSSTGQTSYDAIIDPDLTADSPTNRQWTTVAAALTYLSTAGYTTNQTLRFGMKGRGTTSRVTETVTTITDAMIPSGGLIIEGLGLNVNWKLPSGHNIAAQGAQTMLAFRNILIDGTALAASQTWGGANISMIFEFAGFSGKLTANSTNTQTQILTAGANNTFYAWQSSFLDATATAAWMFVGDSWSFLSSGTNTVTWGGTTSNTGFFQWVGGGFGAAGTATFQFAATSVHMTGINAAQPGGPSSPLPGWVPSWGSAPGNAITLSFTGASTSTVYCQSSHGGKSTDSLPSVLIAAAKSKVELLGIYDTVTVSAGCGTLYIEGYVSTALDIFGPAVINVDAPQAVTLRGTAAGAAKVGESVVGQIRGHKTGGTVYLNMIAICYCSLNVSATCTGTRKAFALDGNCFANLINFAGYSLFATASTETAANLNVTPLGNNASPGTLTKAQNT